MMAVDKKETLFSRWSRRKIEAQQEVETPEVPQPLVESGQAETENTPVQQDVEPVLLTDEDMPPIDSLTEESDFSGFMSAGVSDELRNLALRKLFNAPAFNIRDGLDEYDEDYTFFEKLGDIVTCDMKHAIEMEAQRKREDEEAAAASGEQGQPGEAAESTEVPEADEATEALEVEAAGVDAVETSSADETDEIKPEPDRLARAEAAQKPLNKHKTKRVKKP